MTFSRYNPKSIPGRSRTALAGALGLMLASSCAPTAGDDDVASDPTPTPVELTATPDIGSSTPPDPDPTATPFPDETPWPSETPPPAPAPADADGDGAPASGSPIEVDCDDQDPAVFPGATEVCNGEDDDCNHLIDEVLSRTWYVDADGDGFGASGTSASPSAVTACAAPDGLVSAGGDCDDAAAAVHPGAADAAGDGIDQDCGGADGTQPSVGLEASTYTSIQAALDAAAAGTKVWVGPGTYTDGGLSMRGRAIELRSTHGPHETILDAAGKGHVFEFTSGETSSAMLRGFTVTGGSATVGGGLYLKYTSPTLQDLIIRDNESVYDGGGFYAEGGAATLSDSVVTRNHSKANVGGGGTINGGSAMRVERTLVLRNDSKYQGGGINVGFSYSQLTDVDFVENESIGNQGGGVFSLGLATFTGCRFFKNHANGAGGGAYLDASSQTFRDCLFEGNEATNAGGGLYVYATDARIEGCTIRGNFAQAFGGGLYIRGGKPTLADVAVHSNEADQSGGGIFVDASEPSILGSDIRSNLAPNGYGAGIYLNASAPRIENTQAVGNRAGRDGGGIYALSSSPSIVQTTVAGNSANRLGGGAYIYGDSSMAEIRSSILAYNTGYNLYNDTSFPGQIDLSWSALYNWIGPSHNLEDLGDSSIEEVPGFVGFSNDANGLNDDYHLRPGSLIADAGDPASTDPDGSRADPGAFGGPGADWSYYEDGDADGMFDGWESDHGLDLSLNDAALDPDGDGASNALELDLRSDPHKADTDGDGVSDGDEGDAGSDAADWYSQPGTTFGVEPATARVPGDFPSIQAAIAAVRWEGRIELGPGTWNESLYVQGRRVEIVGTSGAASTVVKGRGGPVVLGLWAELTLRDLTVTGGTASSGGGLYLSQVRGTLSELTVTGNRADLQGGGAYLEYAPVSIYNCIFSGNRAGSGGGVAMRYSSPDVANARFRSNLAESGGGLHIFYSSPVMRNIELSDNEAEEGAGAFLWWSSPMLSQGVVAGNRADAGGGLYLYGSGSKPEIERSILAYNTGFDLYNDVEYPGVPTVRYCDLYATSGSSHNLASIDGTNLSVEPKFQAYDSHGIPRDLHLATGSPLIDVGGPGTLDVDGTTADPGLYGGEDGDLWDLDGDGAPAWFWPGSIDDAPAGFSPADYDCDDLDESRWQCQE